MLFIFLSKPRFLGHLFLDLIFQVICLQVFSFEPYTFKILDITYLSELQFLDLFQQSKFCSIRWVPCWLDTKGLYSNNKSTSFLLLYQTTFWLIQYQGVILIASNELYSHHPHSSSKGIRFCVKLLIWLGLICRMTWLWVHNYKAIREDKVFNKIKSRKVVSQQIKR